MKFFKYLIFLFLSSISISAFADYKSRSYVEPGKTEFKSGQLFSSASSACAAFKAIYTNATNCGKDGDRVLQMFILGNPIAIGDYVQTAVKCPDAGRPFLKSFPAGNPIPTVQCVKHPDGTFCKYENKDAANKVNNMGSTQQVFLYSVGTQPVSNCTDQFAGSCNSNDPYGGCYTPPNDKCTRGSDGSIYCPDDAPPPKVQTGCTGSATYCERPKGGCGSDYVSGSYNGQAVCVRKSDNSGNNNGTGNGNTPTPPGGSTATTNNSDGSKTTVTSDANGNPVSTTVTGADGSSSTTSINKDGTSTTITKNPDGTSSTSTGTTTTVKNPDGSTTTTTVNNNNTTVINNNNNSTTTTTTNPNAGGGNHTTGGTTVVQQAPPVDLSGVISAINAVSEKISWLKDELSTSINDVSGKIDGTNEKLDQSNSKLDESNQNLKDIKDVLNEIKNKPDGSQPSSSPNGHPSDLSGIEGKLDGISETLNAIKDFLLGDTPDKEDGKVKLESIDTPTENNNALKFNAVCPSPVEQNVSIIGYSWTFSFSFDSYCEVLAKLANYFVFVAYLGAAFIIAGVRDA